MKRQTTDGICMDSKIQLPSNPDFAPARVLVMFDTMDAEVEHNFVRETMKGYFPAHPELGFRLASYDCMSFGVSERGRYIVIDGETLFEGDERLPEYFFVRDNNTLFAMHAEAMGVLCLPSARQILLSTDKAITTTALSGVIPMPDTLMRLGEKDDSIGFGYPIISKEASGSLGYGVYKHDSGETLSTMRGACGDPDVIYQTCMPTGDDVRVYVIGDEILYAVRRIPPTGSFKANICGGGHGEPYELTPEQEEMALAAARMISGGGPSGFVAIDFLFDEDGEFTLCEANTSPGFEGVAMAYDELSADQVLRTVLDATDAEAAKRKASVQDTRLL